MPCWTTCSICLTELKNSKKRKKHVGWFLGSSNTIFMLDRFTPCFIQHFIITFTLLSFIIFWILERQISNDSTKLKRSATKNHKHQIELSLNSSEENSDHLPKLQEKNGEEFEDAADRSIFHNDLLYYVLEEPNWCLHFIQSRVLPRRGFSSHQSLQALIVSLAKRCTPPSLIWHRIKEWIDLHVGWNMVDDTYKQYKLSSNIPPTCWIKCWVGLTRPLIDCVNKWNKWEADKLLFQ